MAPVAAAVVGIEVKGVVGNGPTLLHPVRALVFGRRALHQLAVGVLEDLRGVILGDLIPLVVVFDNVLFAGILHIPVRFAAPNYLVGRRSGIGSQCRRNPARNDERANAQYSRNRAQALSFHGLLLFSSCAGSVSLYFFSLPASSLPHMLALMVRTDAHAHHQRVRVKWFDGGVRASPIPVDMMTLSLTPRRLRV